MISNIQLDCSVEIKDVNRTLLAIWRKIWIVFHEDGKMHTRTSYQPTAEIPAILAILRQHQKLMTKKSNPRALLVVKFNLPWNVMCFCMCIMLLSLLCNLTCDYEDTCQLLQTFFVVTSTIKINASWCKWDELFCLTSHSRKLIFPQTCYFIVDLWFLAHLIHQKCLCYRKLEICWFFGSGLGADLSKPIRGSERSHDLGRGSGADPLWLSEPLIGSERSHEWGRSTPDPLLIPSLEDPLPNIMWRL